MVERLAVLVDVLLVVGRFGVDDDDAVVDEEEEDEEEDDDEDKDFKELPVLAFLLLWNE